MNSVADWLSHFKNLHSVEIDLGLTRVEAVWEKIKHNLGINSIAQQSVISVAGTNGKGSSCHMINLMLLSDNHTVGMYTSPHIHDFNERIKINNNPVDDTMLIEAFEAIDKYRDTITISHFEATTLASLLVFAWHKVDFAILETGLGGRLDAINIIDADATLITSIGIDHQEYLGNDASQIAVEKMGICRSNALAVYADDILYETVTTLSSEQNIHLLARSRDYFLHDTCVILGDEHYEIPECICSLGKHQISNYAGVVVLLASLGILPQSYKKALDNFKLFGRMQLIAHKPDIIVDIAHNVDAVKALANSIKTNLQSYENIFAVIAMLADKDHYNILRAFDGVADAIFLGSTVDSGDRSFSDKSLMDIAQKVFIDTKITACTSTNNALTKAIQAASQNDLIIAFGSFLVAEELLVSKIFTSENIVKSK